MAYATMEDLQARWHALTEDEQAVAEVLLEDAAAMLAALVEVNAEDESQAQMLKIVSCSMVTRAMLAKESDAYGVSQMDYGMGPFSQAAHFANPNGDLYLTAQEKRLLGIGSGYISGIRPLIDGAYGSNAVTDDA